tara:strand:- start:997 stop:1302 length:306 start_codon:yes stop_codon:yes gene_type:complete
MERKKKMKRKLTAKKLIAKRIAEVLGYVGMILIHGAIVPTTIANIMGWSNHTPPLSMVVLIQAGLFLYLIRAVAQKDTLYIISNGFGFFMQSVLLSVIVFN